jgi:hypothetical protein
MNNQQKDTQKIETNPYGQNDQMNTKMLINKPVYEFVNKKTEKLVTALYMITDCMDSDDALKGKLRLLGVELLSFMYKLSALSPMEKYTHISLSLSQIREIISFLEISYTIGFVSEMNANILKKEFDILTSELESYQKDNKHFSFTISKDMFEVEKDNPKNYQVVSNMDGLKDNYNQMDKKTYDNLSLIKSPNSLSFIKRTVLKNPNRNERYDKIVSIVKEKKDLPENIEGVSIRDISGQFPECSEKTIQRELNRLIIRGKLKKNGSKRWSRYSIITN